MPRGARRAARTRAAILDAAEAAFRVGGYRGTRIEDVAEAADVSIGSIYNHFGDKDGLYHSLADRSAELFGRYIDAAYAAGETPLERVMACGDAYLRFHLEHPGAFRFLAFEGVEVAGPVADAALVARITRGISGILDSPRRPASGRGSEQRSVCGLRAEQFRPLTCSARSSTNSASRSASARWRFTRATPATAE